MKTVFEARNSLEAHVVRDVLRQQGITAHLLGEFLQGGVGDLPAGGMVRLSVDDDQAQRAQALVRDWDAEQSEPTPGPPARPGAPPAATFAVFALGVLTGGVLMALGLGLFSA